jgi:predicted ester cyclase
MAQIPGSTIPTTDIAARARAALERVCSGAGLDKPSCYYSPKFVDHVNDIELQGLAGVQKSVDGYKAALSDLRIVVEEHLTDGNRVTSRFVVSGNCAGRRIRINGITISHFNEEGLIVEDWSVTDSLGLLRQLGVWRSILVGFRQWRAARKATQR